MEDLKRAASFARNLIARLLSPGTNYSFYLVSIVQILFSKLHSQLATTEINLRSHTQLPL